MAAKKTKKNAPLPTVSETKVEGPKTWSPYQEAIFERVVVSKENLAIIARAGSGKTTTLVEAISRLPKNLKVLVVAFNKSIQTDMTKKLGTAGADGKYVLPKHIDCMTLHSLGFRAVMRRFGRVNLDENKTFNICKDLIGSKYDLIAEMKRCVSLCKATLSDTYKGISNIISDYDIDCGQLSEDEFISKVALALRACKSQTGSIDYDDMIYFPNVYALDVGKYDVVFVDEMQDLNFSQLQMIKSAKKEGTRYICALDPAQAIYAFRAADFNTVQNLLDELSPEVLKLPISYRCPKLIIKEAQAFVHDIEACATAKEGKITSLPETSLIDTIKVGDVVISRTNAILVKNCMKALKRGIPSYIMGRDIGGGLLLMIKKSKAKSIMDLLTWVAEWQKAEIKKATSENRSTDYIKDKAEVLRSLASQHTDVPGLQAFIKELFDDREDNKKVIWSTVHKFKGKEADRIHILDKSFFKGGQEEDNLRYVALTRSKSELFRYS
jgi:DNA helicase-2/ATP-dependent DNA helicase PcrA